jgi:hypothetical protein
MNSMITSYNIDYSTFKNIISETGAIVAGSFALAGYLKQEGIEAGYEPGDMDIFIYGGQFCNSCHTYHEDRNDDNIIKLISFIESNGYKDCRKVDSFGIIPKDEDYYNSISKIVNVASYINNSGKEIQIIAIGVKDIIHHIKTDFDLTCCVSWYDASTNTFQTLKPLLTKNKQMSIIRDIPDDKTLARIEKYKLRGFIVVEKPCPAKLLPDPKIDIEKLVGLEACDIINLEDVKVKDYLAASDWNMILKIGDSFYAFNRKDLYEAMKNRDSSNRHYEDVLYETPLRQSISSKARDIMLFSDYSIFELVSPQTVNYGYDNKKSTTVYSVICYTVHNYYNKTPSMVIIPKRKIVGNKLLETINLEFNKFISSNINQIQPQIIGEFQTLLASLMVA